MLAAKRSWGSGESQLVGALQLDIMCDVVSPGGRGLQGTLRLTLPGHVGELFSFLFRQPSPGVLVMARARACSGRAAVGRTALRSMGTARKVANELRPRHRDPRGGGRPCQPTRGPWIRRRRSAPPTSSRPSGATPPALCGSCSPRPRTRLWSAGDRRPSVPPLCLAQGIRLVGGLVAALLALYEVTRVVLGGVDLLATDLRG